MKNSKKIVFLLGINYFFIGFMQLSLHAKSLVSYRQGLALVTACMATKEFQEFKKKYEQKRQQQKEVIRDGSQVQDNEETHHNISFYEYSKLNFYFFKEYGKYVWRLMKDAVLVPHESIKEKTAFTFMFWIFFFGELGFCIYDLATED